MIDTPGHGRPQPDNDQLRHTLTIHEVSAQLAEAGVPRSERSIKRYCESGFLDAKKVPGPFGEQWFAAPDSVEKVIAELDHWEKMERAGHARLWPDTSEHVIPAKSRDAAPDTAGHGRPEPAVADTETGGKARPETSSDIVQLEREVEGLREHREFLREQIKVKDGQIASLLERDRETNILIGKLQEMLTPLLGAPQREPHIHDTQGPETARQD